MKEWSEYSQCEIDFSHVTGIAIEDDHWVDGDGFEFHYTLRFTMDGEYEIWHNHYCTEEEAKKEALLYAKMCWDLK